MRRLLVAIALVGACGDDLRPPAPDAAIDAPRGISVTYNDAWQGWARGFCAYAERCFPQWVWRVHRDEESCVGDVQVENCSQDWARCASAFEPALPAMLPGQPSATLDAIFRCTADFAALACDATLAPASCAALR